MTKQEIIKILKENKNLIENNKFKRFYDKIDLDDRHYFTDLFLKSEINPLNYMEEIPIRYAYMLENLKNIIIPNNIKSIGDHAFEYCKNLANVKFEENSQLKKINPSAFYKCKNLTNIEIPNNVTNIGYGAFYDCSSLTSIIISNNLTSIGYGAFEHCISLTSIEIPSSVKNIDRYAFYNCLKLKNIYYQGSKEDWEKIEIGENNEVLNRETIHYNSKI